VLVPSAGAQTQNLDVRITPGATSRTTGGLLTGVSVVNTGTEPLSNVQLVVRVPAAPSQIQIVNESAAPLGDPTVRAGVIDERTGLWYHTIVSIPAGASAHFTVNWFNPCVGRWPFAARAGDRRTFVSYQFSGGTLSSCGLDDVAQPTPAAWFELPWPPSVVTTTSTTTSTLAGATTTAPTATIPGGAIPTAAPSVPGSSIAPGSTSIFATPSTSAPSTVARSSTTKARPTTAKPTTTKKSTVEIVCKTVGGRRYCGPKSSALKPGQAKPRSVAPTTKKKSKT
jgi:hypothetical protein